MNSNLVSVVIPAYNEEKYIQQTIRTVMKLPYHKEVIVVEDGSGDRTKQILQDLLPYFQDLKVLFLEGNMGKGQALMMGIDKARGDILVFLDADLGETIHHATALINPVIEGNADMTIAVLPPAQKKGGFGLVKKLAQSGIYTYTGYRTAAPLSGQRALKREVMKKVSRLEPGFGIEVGLTIDVLNSGFKLQEIDVPFSHRETGRDFGGFLHRGREFRDVMATLIKKRRSN